MGDGMGESGGEGVGTGLKMRKDFLKSNINKICIILKEI